MFSENPTLALLRRLMNPMLVVLVLLACMALQEEPLDGYYLMLAIVTFFISSYLFDDLTAMQPSAGRVWRGFGGVLLAWIITAGAVSFLGYVSRLQHHYYMPVIKWWFSSTPLVLFLAQVALRGSLHYLHRHGHGRRAVIVGGSHVGEQLGRRLISNDYLLIDLLGYFDDRPPQRLTELPRARYAGHTRELGDFIKRNQVEVIYIALPISQRERITALLNQLSDTTASVYLVPDIFTFDLIQARVDHIGSVPIIAILETPLTSVNAFNKRLFDIVLSLLLLALFSPLILLIALAVKLSSPGPVIFKQRRYGLNGESIVVYKFRTMRTCEDGDAIRQATPNDDRITPLGSILRKSSLDELPQFLNVLQGRMSIVGPRPHAVAHNELYRKQIAGYMRRHKVKPGITGWAQVNGLRGETETVEQMAERVRLDIDYLRNWSLSLDLTIILKTIRLLFNDANAY
jgi:putative colanic acid biosynthesis UDP-glucose lipid carrier transferase